MKKFNPIRKKSKINYPFSKGRKGKGSTQDQNESEERKTRIGLQCGQRRI